MGNETVILGRATGPGKAYPTKKACEKAGMIPHSKDGRYSGCWKPAGLGQVAKAGAMPGVNAIVGQRETRVYNPWMVILGASAGHVGFTTGATLLEVLPAEGKTFSKIVPWIEVGVGTLNILFAYLFRGNSFLFGTSAAGITLIPRGVGLFIVRLIAARRVGAAPAPAAPASAPGARSGQFTPEEQEGIRKAEEELLGKLRTTSAARVGATPQVTPANLQPRMFADRKRSLYG